MSSKGVVLVNQEVDDRSTSTSVKASGVAAQRIQSSVASARLMTTAKNDKDGEYTAENKHSAKKGLSVAQNINGVQAEHAIKRITKRNQRYEKRDSSTRTTMWRAWRQFKVL